MDGRESKQLSDAAVTSTCGDDDDDDDTSTMSYSTDSTDSRQSPTNSIFDGSTFEIADDDTSGGGSVELEPHLLYPICELHDDNEQPANVVEQVPQLQVQQLPIDDLKKQLLGKRQSDNNAQMQGAAANLDVGPSTVQPHGDGPQPIREETAKRCGRHSCGNRTDPNVGPYYVFCSAACSMSHECEEQIKNMKD